MLGSPATQGPNYSIVAVYGRGLNECPHGLLFSSNTAQALWHVDDLNSFINNLADRITDALRNLYSDAASDADALGKHLHGINIC